LFNAKSFTSTDIVDIGSLRALPLGQINTYFKSALRIRELPDGNLIVVDNVDSTIEYLSPQGKVLKRIGKPGQGPGDLNHPYHIWVGESEIYVSDDEAVSRFDLRGNYIDRFKDFRGISGLTASNDRVYVVEEYADCLITSYGLRGEKKAAFGKRYSVGSSPRQADGIPDWVLHMGSVLYLDGHIYFVSHLFGDIFKYDLAGNLMNKRMDLESPKAAENRSIVFEKKEKKISIHNRLFNDIIIYKNKIYALEYVRRGSEGHIWEIDPVTLTPNRKFRFLSPGPGQFVECISFFIRQAGQKTEVLISYYDFNEGDICIGIARINI
jgi:hypothetical protein